MVSCGSHLLDHRNQVIRRSAQSRCSGTDLCRGDDWTMFGRLELQSRVYQSRCAGAAGDDVDWEFSVAILDVVDEAHAGE